MEEVISMERSIKISMFECFNDSNLKGGDQLK